MCGGVEFTHKGRDYRLYFPNPRAVLPVSTRNGDVRLLPWGRRIHQVGQLPRGGWARLDSIYAGRWDRFFPVPVKIPIHRFMEKNLEGESKWYEIPGGQWIQGMVANERHEQRVYIVTIEPEIEDADHDRWPRICAA